jgi:hypothetical protein
VNVRALDDTAIGEAVVTSKDTKNGAQLFLLCGDEEEEEKENKDGLRVMLLIDFMRLEELMCFSDLGHHLLKAAARTEGSRSVEFRHGFPITSQRSSFRAGWEESG